MEDKRDPLTQPEAGPAVEQRRDPRPSDLEVFFSLLPGVLGSLAAKSPDSASANSMALMMVREMLGQCAAMGVLRPETRLLDGSPLARMPNQGAMAMPAGAAPPIAQYPNQPGMGQPSGGGVQQYPNYGGGGGGGGGGNKGVLVAMYPNNNNPPPQL
jgi:hypothetical protein